MQDENGLPSQADLDAVNAELLAESGHAAGKTDEPPAAPASPAKAAHDAMLGGMTAQLPDVGAGPDAEAAIAYVMGKGFSRQYAESLVKKNGVDVVLQAKATEDAARAAAVNVPKEIKALGAEPSEIKVSRHGEVFNPEIHAQLPTGDPKTDSTGKFIMKVHDYAGPRPNAQFPD